MVELDRVDKFLIFGAVVIFCILFVLAMFKQEKISKANIEIETKDYVFYSYKETIKINPNSLCISFYNILKEYNVDHCGEYTVKYIK